MKLKIVNISKSSSLTRRSAFVACIQPCIRTFHMRMQPSSCRSMPRAMSPGIMTRPVPLSCPSRLTMSTPAFEGSTSATRLYLEPRRVHSPVSRLSDSRTHLRMSSSIAGLIFAAPLRECRPLPDTEEVVIGHDASIAGTRHTDNEVDLCVAAPTRFLDRPLCKCNGLLHIQAVQVDFARFAILDSGCSLVVLSRTA